MADKRVVDKGPEPGADCPRCHHFEQDLPRREDDRLKVRRFPPIDQQLALDVLTAAFPRAYGVKR